MVLHFFIGVATFGLIVMCLLFVLGIIMITRERQFGQQTCSVQGEVIDLKERVSRRRSRGRVYYRSVYHPVVQFRREEGRVAGQLMICEVPTGSFPPMYAVGTHLPLLYDPANPTRVHINTFRGRWLGLCLWFFICLMGMGMFTFMLISTVSMALHP